jgi:TolB-like protein
MQTSAAVLFGGFLFDRSAGGLFRLDEGGCRVPIVLGSRALDVLCMLIERQGELVSKQAIMDAVWPNTSVEEHNLVVQVTALRRQLDQGRSAGSCIQTVTGRGYRFLSPVTAAPAERPASDGASATDKQQSVLPMAPTIAVLPFVNFSQEPRWDRLCDGVVEDIITSLARHRDLLVIARHSSFAYRGQVTDVREIGHALGARYVLEGSVQAESGWLKVTAQLISSASGVHIWAGSYAREEADLFAIQDEIVEQAVAALAGFGGAILQTELMEARRKPPASLRAYELYVLGYEQEARLDRDGTIRSIDLLKAALAADPHLSRAWTVLRWAYANLADNGWTDDVEGTRVLQRGAALKAAELDPGDSLALMGLAQQRIREGNLIGAGEAVERALVLGASHADTLAFLARYVATLLDRPSEAVTLMNRSFVLNPHAPSWYYVHHIRVAYFARHFDLVLDHFGRLMSSSSTRMMALRAQKLLNILALAQLGREAEVTVAIRELRDSDPNLAIIQFEAVGLCPAALGLFVDGVRKAQLHEELSRASASHLRPATGTTAAASST